MESDFSLEDLAGIWQKYLDVRVDPEFLQLTIRFPYCSSKCTFCKYETSSSYDANMFINVLKRQIDVFKPVFKDYRFRVLKIVGGTFNILPIKYQQEILMLITKNFNFDFNNNYLFSIEVSNSDLTKNMVDLYRSFGCNKVLMGIQSFDEKILKSWNRCDKINYSIMEYISSKTCLCLDIIHDVDEHPVELFESDFNKAHEYARIIYAYYIRSTSHDKNARWVDFMKDYLKDYNFRYYGDDFVILPRDIKYKNIYSSSTFREFDATLGLGEDVYSINPVIGLTYHTSSKNDVQTISKINARDHAVIIDGPKLHARNVKAQTDSALYKKMIDSYNVCCYRAGF